MGVVCIEYDSNGDGAGDSYAKFHPKVDDLSEFQVNEVDSGNIRSGGYWQDNANASTQIRGVVGDKVTPWVSLTQKNSNNQVVSQISFLTLMVNIKGGRLDSINFDNNCVCDTCYQHQCHTGFENALELKMFTVWTGTDTDSSVMLSAANRYSELSKYSTTKMYDNMKD